MAQDPHRQFRNKGDLFASEEHTARNKRQRQEKRKGTREKEGGYLSQEDKGLLLGREETDAAHRLMAVY